MPGLGQRHLRILAERKHALFPTISVFETPELIALNPHEQIEPRTIKSVSSPSLGLALRTAMSDNRTEPLLTIAYPKKYPRMLALAWNFTGPARTKFSARALKNRERGNQTGYRA